MKDMNKAISHQKPIKKVVNAIRTHKMSNRKLSIQKWNRCSTRAIYESIEPQAANVRNVAERHA